MMMKWCLKWRFKVEDEIFVIKLGSIKVVIGSYFLLENQKVLKLILIWFQLCLSVISTNTVTVTETVQSLQVHHPSGWGSVSKPKQIRRDSVEFISKLTSLSFFVSRPFDLFLFLFLFWFLKTSDLVSILNIDLSLLSFLSQLNLLDHHQSSVSLNSIPTHWSSDWRSINYLQSIYTPKLFFKITRFSSCFFSWISLYFLDSLPSVPFPFLFKIKSNSYLYPIGFKVSL